MQLANQALLSFQALCPCWAQQGVHIYLDLSFRWAPTSPPRRCVHDTQSFYLGQSYLQNLGLHFSFFPLF